MVFKMKGFSPFRQDNPAKKVNITVKKLIKDH